MSDEPTSTIAPPVATLPPSGTALDPATTAQESLVLGLGTQTLPDGTATISLTATDADGAVAEVGGLNQLGSPAPGQPRILHVSLPADSGLAFADSADAGTSDSAGSPVAFADADHARHYAVQRVSDQSIQIHAAGEAHPQDPAAAPHPFSLHLQARQAGGVSTRLTLTPGTPNPPVQPGNTVRRMGLISRTMATPGTPNPPVNPGA